MAAPRVFISSTCYDLKHIRESLKYFISELGYEPVLSDDGDVFYNPTRHTHDSCLDEVSTCQLFVLIIGGRYGGKYTSSQESITNEEYRVAIDNNIPIFTLLDSAVSADHHLYQSNNKNEAINRDKIKYPASDNIKIFGFINEVRQHTVNNAIHPFRNFLDIETYLKKQWAGMLFDFLLKVKNDKQGALTNKLLSDLTLASRKTEELLKIVYGKLDEENADKVINDVSDTVNAESFISFVMEMTKGEKLIETNITRLTRTSMSKGWVDYLINAADFYIKDVTDHQEGITDCVLWPPTASQLGQGISKKGEGPSKNEKKITLYFNALKSLDKNRRKELLKELLKDNS